MTLHEGTYDVNGAKGPDGKPLAIEGSYLNTLVKKGGACLIAGHMAFVPPPPGMVPAKADRPSPIPPGCCNRTRLR